MIRKFVLCLILILGVLIFSNVFGLNEGTHQNQAGVVSGTFSRVALKSLNKLFLPFQTHLEEPAQFPQFPEKDAIVDSDVETVQASKLPDIAYADIVLPTAEKYGVDWRLVTAVMEVESRFKPHAVSSKGAVGLMQIMPTTGRLYHIKRAELYDPQKNVEAGVQHLKMLTDRYNGDLKLAIAAYNTGEGVVDHYRGIPPYRTTRNFVKQVLNRYNSQIVGE